MNCSICGAYYKFLAVFGPGFLGLICNFGKINLSGMAVMCDKSHSHKPWGLTKEANSIWATAPERNYPEMFCKKIATRVVNALLPKVFRQREAPEIKKWSGTQSRLAQKDLVAEFAAVLDFQNATPAELARLKLDFSGQVRSCGSATIDGDAKLLNVEERGLDGLSIKGRVGVYHTPEAFVEIMFCVLC